MKRLTERFKANHKGMTLIEIIIAIAILGILSVAFLMAFSSGVKWTFWAGHRTKAAMAVRDAMDSVYYMSETMPTTESVDHIVADHLSAAQVTNKSTSPSTLAINGVTPPGTVVTLTCNVNGQQVTVTAYVPR